MIHCLSSGREVGSVLELRTHRMRAQPTGAPISLSRHALQPHARSSAQEQEAAYADFGRQLNAALVLCGKREGDGATVFVGATGGVRKLVTDGEVSEMQVGLLSRVLTRVVGGGHGKGTFEVLTGEREALCELKAARSIFGKHFLAHGQGRVDMFSGGGATCQFAYGATCQLFSVEVSVDAGQKRLLAVTSGERDALHAAAKATHAEFTSSLSWAKLPTFEGAFLGVAMHQDAANLGGFENQFLSPSQAMAQCENLVNELIEQTGECWQRACDRWGDKAGIYWVIVAVAAIRLRAILVHFSAGATLFFARAPPDDVNGRPDGLWRDECPPTVAWPIGMKLLLEAELNS